MGFRPIVSALRMRMPIMIRFKCMYCGEPLEAPASQAGGKIDCPQCNHAVAVRRPENPTPSSNPGPPNHDMLEDDEILIAGPPVQIQTNNSPNPTPLPTSPSELPPPTPDQLPKIHFKCSCGQALKASMEHAGKRINCPHCSQKRTIPERSEY